MLHSFVKPRLRRELRFVTSTENVDDEQWHDSEFISIADRSGNNGVLLLELEKCLYVLPYELKTGIVSSATGRSQSVICDLCRTWQYGDKSGSITFVLDKKSTVSYLCCADLKCSQHIRNKTQAAHISRAQLREDLSIEQRVRRLESRLMRLVKHLRSEPVKNS